MNIDDKRRLWSKYYLSQASDKKDNIFLLTDFVISEVNMMHLPTKMAEDKRKKLLKNMLQFLPKKHILKNYCNIVHIRRETNKSKNDIIKRLVRII